MGEEFYGYHNYYQILSAENYNCPQARPRLFTVSLLSDEPFVFPEKMELIRNLKDIIDKNVNFNEYQPSDAEKEILFQFPDGTWCVKEATKKGYKEIQEYQVVNLAFPNSKTRRAVLEIVQKQLLHLLDKQFFIMVIIACSQQKNTYC